MAWVKVHDELRLGDKRGLSRATRFVFVELLLLARPERGVIRLPRNMKDLDAVYDLLGGNRKEVNEAIRALTTPDEHGETMVEFKSVASSRQLVINSWARWNGSDDPARRMRELRARKQAVSESALRNNGVTVREPLRPSDALDIEKEIEQEEENKIAVIGGSLHIVGLGSPTSPLVNSDTLSQSDEKAPPTAPEGSRATSTRPAPPKGDHEPKAAEQTASTTDTKPTQAITTEQLQLTPPEPVAKDTPAKKVFAAYVSAWSAKVKTGRAPVLTDAREALINRRLKKDGFGVDDLIAACEGVFLSDWHVDNGQTSIDLVMRDAAHVERFRDIAGQAKSGKAQQSQPRQQFNRPIVSIQKDDWS